MIVRRVAGSSPLPYTEREMYTMNRDTKTVRTGSVWMNIGASAVVAAIAVAAAGAGGLQAMGSTPEAVQLVAGCALVGMMLLSVGVLLIGYGVGRRTEDLYRAIEMVEDRVDRHERDTDYTSTVDGIVRSNEHRQMEVRLDDLISLVKGRLEGESRETTTGTRSSIIRKSEV
jgi:hypothetical protein